MNVSNSKIGFNGVPNLEWWKRSAFPVILAAVLGALGGGPGFRAIEDPRRDPFTGRQAETMEARLVGQIDARAYSEKLQDEKFEKRLDRMDSRFTALTGIVAELPPDKLVERVTRSEEKLNFLEKSCVKWAPTARSMGD